MLSSDGITLIHAGQPTSGWMLCTSLMRNTCRYAASMPTLLFQRLSLPRPSHRESATALKNIQIRKREIVALEEGGMPGWFRLVPAERVRKMTLSSPWGGPLTLLHGPKGLTKAQNTLS